MYWEQIEKRPETNVWGRLNATSGEELFLSTRCALLFGVILKNGGIQSENKIVCCSV